MVPHPPSWVAGDGVEERRDDRVDPRCSQSAHAKKVLARWGASEVRPDRPSWFMLSEEKKYRVQRAPFGYCSLGKGCVLALRDGNGERKVSLSC